MPPDVITPYSQQMPPVTFGVARSTTKRKPAVQTDHENDDSLFEHVAWVYAFCRERLFRDDTERMIETLWAERRPAPGTRLIEIGCGPGFYSCRLAERFPHVSVMGVDRSESQLKWARQRAGLAGLSNCTFKRINALELSCADAEFDLVIASRLFTVLPEQDRVIGEMYRVLKPGGRCFIAEPRYAVWASIPLFAMRLLAGLTRFRNGYREPHKATVFSTRAFADLFPTQPWKGIKIWRDGRYQYALCEKA